MTSIVFPGQGSQFIGMARDFHDNFKIAKETFEEIEEYVEMDIRRIIFENDEKKLDTTQYTQICIFTTSYVIFKTLDCENYFEKENVNVMLGHSLGEYTALACSKKINLKECCLILKARGELMNKAVPSNTTGMAALIGKDSAYVAKIINNNDLKLEIANDNSPIQVVVSGLKDEINKSKDIFLVNNIKKFVNLNVSAAFHSQYMLNAQEILSNEIDKINFFQNDINIISNFDAKIYNDNSLIKKNLQNQMANKVNWTESIRNLEKIGETKIIEIGPGKVLSGLIKRITNNFDIESINQISDIKLNEKNK
tara:strand:- start:355 stop:1284 length:930 start_codon:yes stop_codon:yes gene_type:complete